MTEHKNSVPTAATVQGAQEKQSQHYSNTGTVNSKDIFDVLQDIEMDTIMLENTMQAFDLIQDSADSEIVNTKAEDKIEEYALARANKYYSASYVLRACLLDVQNSIKNDLDNGWNVLGVSH
jgi:hypothetical protein